MNVTNNGKIYEYEDGTILKNIAEDLAEEYKYPILLANVDGKLQELHHHLNHDANVVFFTSADPIGYQTIRRSMSMLFITAVYHVVGQMPDRPSANVRTVLHFSIDTGFFYTIDEDIEITDEFLADVEKEMRRMISLKLPFRKRTITTRDAVDLFHRHGMYDKEMLFSTRLVSRVNVYSLDGYEDYYYGYMTMDTEFLGNFRLLRYHDGVIMVMPTDNKPDEIPEFHPEEKLFETQLAGEEFAENKQLGCVGELNSHVISGGMREVILISEAHQESRISEIASRIADRGDVKFVLVAGPSSSGKTTFSQRLCVQLHAHGLKPNYIGVDNYFIPRDELPVDENGKRDFECLEAIDLECFNNDMNALLEGKEISVPTYDFVSGKRVFTGEKLRLSEGEILVIEGIHCLNDGLTYSLPASSKFKIYISALTQVNVDEHNRIPTRDGRLLRRIIRDHRTRGYSAQNTLNMWDDVRHGEENYIFPYQDSADEFFNSALPYELAVIKQYAQPLLFSVPEDDPQYYEARRLLKFLDYFLGIPLDDVPTNSILREFLGGGCFRL